MSELIEDIKKISPEIIIISTWTYGMPFTIELIKEIRKISKAKIKLRIMSLN